MNITEEHVRKILSILDHGLIAGLGKPIPGQMCVEAVVCLVLGLPHGDDPPCVGEEVRAFKIELNDKSWTTPFTRAEGMRELAIAQLGSDTLDQRVFKDLLWLRLGTQIQPLIWRYLATKGNEKARLKLADKLESSQSLDECKTHTRGYDYAYDYAYGYDYAYAYGYDYAYDYAYGYGYAYDYGYGYGYGYAYDVWLSKVANIGVSVLKELNSPGCAYLPLCNTKSSPK